MIIGVLSDTHNDERKAIPHIVNEFKKRGVQMIVHCGDIVPEHVSCDLFGNLPVVCALVDNQKDDPVYDEHCPPGWRFTRTGKRVVRLLDGMLVYVGHKRHMDFLKMSEEKFTDSLADLRQEFDGLRMVFGGHLHFQTFKQGQLVSFVNPGAVEGSFGEGSEFAIVDTKGGQLVFSRIVSPPGDDRKTFSVGVISDSLDISHRDVNFWHRLAKEFHDRDVSHIVHCGNISLRDIGREELKDFFIHYAIRSDQKFDYAKILKERSIPENWRIISNDDLDNGAVVDINGYRFFVQLDLGLKFLGENERSMDSIATQIRRKYPETEFVLCGFTREALLVEGQQVVTVNPGDVNSDRSFAVICLPRREITFGHVPYDSFADLTVEK